MAKNGGKTRRGKTGKIVTGGHSTHVEGLDRFLAKLEQWPEITTIRVGQIRVRNSIGRSNKKMVVKSDTDEITGVQYPIYEQKQARKRAKSGGGFSFRATRWAVNNSTGQPTGIHCNACYGRSMQEVVLTSSDLPALKARLHREGYGADWQDVKPAEAQA